jgi:hypothetical protein
MAHGNSDKNLERINLPIIGMSCAACAARIEKGIGSLYTRLQMIILEKDNFHNLFSVLIK